MLNDNTIREKEIEAVEYMDIPNIIELNVEELNGYKMNEYKFIEGIDSVSKICGQLTALMNCGLTSDQALEYILNVIGMQHNKGLQKIVNESQENVALINAKSREELSL